MPGTKTKKITPKQLITEIEKCLLLSDEDKQFWLENSENLPRTVVDSLYKNIHDKNLMMAKYLAAAIDNDPEQKLIGELKQKIKKLKATALQIEEKEQQSDVDAVLNDDLSNL